MVIELLSEIQDYFIISSEKLKCGWTLTSQYTYILKLKEQLYILKLKEQLLKIQVTY